MTLKATEKHFFKKTIVHKVNGVKVSEEEVDNLILAKIGKSLQQLSYDVTQVYGLEMPECWISRYPMWNFKEDNKKGRKAPTNIKRQKKQ